MRCAIDLAVPVLIYLQSFRCNSPLKCAPQQKIAKKSLTPTKTPYLGGSRLFKFIEVDTPKKLVTSACYDKQHAYAYLQLFSCYTSQY